MKILFTIPFLGCGGAEILTGTIALQLNKLGHDVRIVCFQDYHETWPNFPNKNELIDKIPIVIINDFISFKLFRKTKTNHKSLQKVIQDFKPDVIHSHLFLAEIYTRSIVFEGIKYFSHGHDNMPQLKKFRWNTLLFKTSFINYWERNWLIKKYSEANNKFIAISKDVCKYLSNEIPSFKNRIHYLPNAINTNNFHHNRNYTKTNQPFHIVSIANLVPKKNHKLLISVLEILINKGFDVTIDVYGFGPLMDELKFKTKEKGLDKRLIFHGSVGGIPEKLERADLYVHPANYEPFGLVLLEAMASGLPVVSLDGYGNRELMENNKNGFIIPQNMPIEEFTNKIIYFIENNAERERMGKYAREFAEKYSIEKYTDKLLSIYNMN